jgi:hypothetical protein
MSAEKIILKNSGGIPYNDVVYDKLFELENTAYSFTLTPKTQFWRFGIRFSRDQTIGFYQPNGRYNNSDYPNIEFNVGYKPPSGDWSDTNRLEFGYYYLPNLDNGHPFDRWDEYESLMPVQIDMIYGLLTETLTVSYQISDRHFYEKKIDFPGFKYFKIFAWADWTDFEIECIINSTDLITKRSRIDTALNVTVAGSTASESVEYVKKVFYNPNFNTEGNHRETEDQLEFNDDIESIASVMALKAIHPPLAIGLFGKWGSGKSFFMDKLSERIENYANTGGSEYVKNVVQVKFNSWHYSDSNLWASLISEIFNALNEYAHRDNPEDVQKLGEMLEFTNLQKIAKEARKRELQIEVDKLTQEQREIRENLKDISGINLLKLFISDEKVRDDLSEYNTPRISDQWAS